jgi:hypothetical protein
MRQSNIQNIRYTVSPNETEERYRKLAFDETHEDFMLSLQLKSLQINYNNLIANENAEHLANFSNQSLFVIDGENSCWKTTVHFTEYNEFLKIEEVIHTYETSYTNLMEIKAALIHNNYKKCEFSIFPTKDFLENINLYKLGKLGKAYTDKIDFLIDYEY